jgi:hypothetical protein
MVPGPVLLPSASGKSRTPIWPVGGDLDRRRSLDEAQRQMEVPLLSLKPWRASSAEMELEKTK